MAKEREDGGIVAKKGSVRWWYRRVLGVVGCIVAGLFIAALAGGEEMLQGSRLVAVLAVSVAAYLFIARKVIFGSEEDVKYNDEV